MAKKEKKDVSTPEEEAAVSSRADDECVDADESVLEDGQIKKELEEARVKADEYLEAARRIQAEFDNYRKRNAALRAEAMDEGAREAVMPLLRVYDNLERAVRAADEAGDASPIADGVRLCQKGYFEALEGLGVSEIAAEGAAFDPNVHNAVMTAEPEEEGQDGTVAEVLQKGYMMRDRVLRVAMVKVYHT